MKPSPNCASPSFSVICAANRCSSATSASVRRDFPSHCFGRCSGVTVLFAQTPWKSGWPSGVRGSLARLGAEGDGGSQDEDGREDASAHVSSAFRVSGIQIHMIAASKNATPATANAAKKPRDAASDPTTNGAAALAMRPVL